MSETKLGVASIRALQYLAAKEDNAIRPPTYGWHMPSQRTATACRRTLEPKGMVTIERISDLHFRYRITDAGRAALSVSEGGK